MGRYMIVLDKTMRMPGIKRNKVLVIINKALLVFIAVAVLQSCATYHEGWVGMMNYFSRTQAKFDLWNQVEPNTDSPLKTHYPLWGLRGDGWDKDYEKIIPEGKNKRYYIYYWDRKPPRRKTCYYSVLFAPDGTFLSWRFEDDKYKKECIVYY